MYHALAIVDLPLEITECVVILSLAVTSIMAVRYIRRLRSSMKQLQKQLEDQSKFTYKLNETVDRMLKIDEEGGIDSNHQYRK